jgi:hypothetical protein
MNDKNLWMAIRRALLMVVAAIDKKFTTMELEVERHESESVSYTVDEET